MLSPINHSGVGAFTAGGQEPVTHAINDLEQQGNVVTPHVASDGFTSTNALLPQMVSLMGMACAPGTGPQQPANPQQVKEFVQFLQGLMLGLVMGMLRTKREAALTGAANDPTQAVAPAGGHADPSSSVHTD
jgi:hypothetical protein